MRKVYVIYSLRKMKRLWALAVLSFLSMTGAALNAQTSDTLHLTLALFQRTRAEWHEGYKELPSHKPAAAFVSQRTQLGLGFKYRQYETYINVQDGRIWGGKADPASLLLEGWLQIRNSYSSGFFRSLRVGRQEIQLDDAWLFMARRYAKTGLAHDALRLQCEYHRLSTDFFAMYNTNDEANSRSEFYAQMYYKYMFIAHANYQLAPQNSLAAIAVGDCTQVKDSPTRLRTRFTGGFIINLTPVPIIQMKTELYYQGGTTYSALYSRSMEVRAFSIHSRLFVLSKVKTGVGVDWVSGGTQADIDRGRLYQFDRLSGTSHTFFGYMDYFAAQLPTLKGHGLRDLNLWAYSPKVYRTQVELSLHAFQMDKHPVNVDPFLGGELDFKATLDLHADMRLEVVYGYFYATHSLVALQGSDPKQQGHFASISLQYAPKFGFNWPVGKP